MLESHATGGVQMVQLSSRFFVLWMVVVVVVVAAIGDDKRQSILVGRGAAQSRVGDVLKRLPVWLLFNARLDGCRGHRFTALRDRLARLGRLAQDPFAGENKGS